MLLTEYSKTVILFCFIFDKESDSICVMAATDRNQKAKGLEYELKMSDEEKKSMSFSEYFVLNCLYIGADVKKFGFKIKMSLFQQFPELHYISIKMGSRKIKSIVELSYVSSFSKCKRCERCITPPAHLFFDMRRNEYVQMCSDCLATWHWGINDNHETYNFMSLYNKFLCKNSSDGCNYTYSYSAAKTHQNICPLNIILCALCEWQGRRDSLNTHINEKHEISDIHDRYDLCTSTKLFKFDDQFLSCSVVMRHIADEKLSSRF
ncbi:hypothetical protein WA026_021695 [Henosepilachna vigintioctopunctata]|uniref:SIAH-type domain-containing protein n=1 Tax=Henosepilachna vigintioctopunctata TaxID=420089 RepID=A0AAW1UCQ5_9CUCU